MLLPINQVVVGDCADVMRGWPADSIDLVVTSPPYWGLRDYGIGEDQLGLEPHPQMFIDNLVEICREIKRVLKPTGTFWLNLGDTYCSTGGGARGGNDSSSLGEKTKAAQRRGRYEGIQTNWLQPKQRLMMPARVAVSLQNDGWILRNDIIWHKPNHMPSSVKDRLTNAYEHVFLFAKARRYYFDLDAIRQPSTSTPWSAKSSKEPYQQNNPRKEYDGKFKPDIAETLSSPRARQATRESTSYYHPRGKNPGDVWRIATRPFPGAHFATFPPDLIEPIIKAGSPHQVCKRCGGPREKQWKTTPPPGRLRWH